MGDWTTSYRWEGVTRAKFAGLVRHDARDVDRANGVEVAHSNTMIDPTFTDMNVSLVNDGSGVLVPMQDVEEAVAFLDRRIGQTRNTRVVKDPKTGQTREVTIALRSDAAAAVEFILQLDPEYTRDQSTSQEDYDALTPAEYEALPVDAKHLSPEQIADVTRLLGVMIDEVTEQMGAENVVCITTHWDETHPHVQMMVVPVTDDGVISMKQVLGGATPGVKPTKAAAQARYAAMHDSMRKRLVDAGYDATLERVAAGKRHLGLTAYKQHRNEVRATRAEARAVAQKAITVRARETEASVRERMVELRTDDLAQQERALPAIRQKAHEEGYADGMAAADAAVALATAEERQRLAEATQRAEQARAASEAQRMAMLAVEKTAADLIDELRVGRQVSTAAKPRIAAAVAARNAALHADRAVRPLPSAEQDVPER